jgi:hypothetical protein
MQPYRSSFDTYDATGVPHIETVIVKGPFTVDSPGDTPSRARVFSCRPKTPAQEEPLRATDSDDVGAPRLSAAGRAGDVNRVMDFYRSSRKGGGTSTRASSSRCSAFSPARSSCCASSAIPRR